ncbi:MAG: hypothetical protein ACP5MG_09670 [Verrucomicrobiia bacterium]
MSRVSTLLSVFGLCFFAPIGFCQDLVINGVSDRSTYNDRAWFYVPAQGGFTYAVFLNGVSKPVNVTNWVDRMDYYELFVYRTNNATFEITNRLVRFIVLSSDRGNPEKGLIKWTPYPLTPSASGEFEGAYLKLLAPQTFPQGLPIPIIARVEDSNGNERRVNGRLSASGFEGYEIKLFRGHGSGFLPPKDAPVSINYSPGVYNMSAQKTINIESNTAWVQVSGTISGNSTWQENSRIYITANLNIPADATLTIGAGAVVKLNQLVNITNSGTLIINGTPENPVIFTATNVVYPENNAGAWGGFIMRGSSSRLIANNAIFAGGGGATSFSFSPGSSHRSEQPVFLLQSGAAAYMTNCAVINTAGQVGNGYQSDLTLDHCHIQRAITCGEYAGGTIIINHTAIFEFPIDDGVVNAAIADADYDAIYFTEGTHILINSLFGFSKDDAIDSGSGGAGTVLVSNCWVEAALHEALAWSGGERVTWSYDSVLINCGQGIESGWSSGNNSPLCYAERLLSTANSVGARFGDNYDGTYNGFLQVSNSIIIHNYRDIFGMNWSNWTYCINQMDLRSNYITAPNTNHPNNFIWNPQADGWRLAPFMKTPIGVPVGIGFAVRSNSVSPSDFTNGIPIRLSTFTVNPVSIKYSLESGNAVIVSGQVEFLPGETLKQVVVNSPIPTNQVLRLRMSEPSGCEITGVSEVWYLPGRTVAGDSVLVLINSNSVWKYLDDGSNQGIVWRGLNFNDSNWKSGAGELGFGDGDERTVISRTNSQGQQIITYYFRRYFVVDDPSEYENLTVLLRRDDGGIVYINGVEVFRSNMPSGTNITYTTTASGAASDDGYTWFSTVAPATMLVGGTNVCAVEIHQANSTSSDVSFDLQLKAKKKSQLKVSLTKFGKGAVLDWNADNTILETTDNLAHPWKPILATPPFSVDFSSSQGYFRIRKI